MKDGGRYEDIPAWHLIYRRSVNHFHNPLTEEGFNGYFFGLLLSGDSSIVWAQKPLSTQNPGGYYSWYDVRDYFYKALTPSNKSDREKNFAETFRGLGQLMHLIHDASVPSHTRDDAHVVGYEKWVEKNINFNTINPIFFDNTILNRQTSNFPIANIFDTNQYNGTNPNIAIGNNTGLAEYTNVNFFSEDTINSKNFPYPIVDSNTPIVGRAYTNQLGTYIRQYYLKNCCGETNAGQGYLLSAADYLNYWRQKFPLLSIGLTKIPVLDSNVYRDYASFLIPRAVGYSAGLLHYFFRGNMEAVEQKGITNSSGNIIGAKLRVKNKTPEEAMGSGKLVISYHYRISESSASIYGISNEVSMNEIVNSDEVTTAEFTFYFNNLIPQNAKDIQYYLVYRGKLGNEKDSVIGRKIEIKPWLRGGMLLIFSWSPQIIDIKISYEKEIKSYQVTMPKNEHIIRTAFDEGSVDTIRVLSTIYIDGQTVWRLHTFVYDKEESQYKPKNTEEIFSSNLVRSTNKTEFAYTKEESGSYPSYKATYNFTGFVAEELFYDASIIDFFVPQSGETQFIKWEGKEFKLYEPYAIKCESNYTIKYSISNIECISEENIIQEYLESPLLQPYCTYSGTISFNHSECGSENSWDLTGLCTDIGAYYIGYGYWITCDETASFVPASAWLYESLKYGDISMKLSNPEYDGSSQAWTVGPKGPCILFDPDAAYVIGMLSGKILSDKHIALHSELRQGFNGESVESTIAIEPGGIELTRMPYLLLRQSGGFSFFESFGGRNYTSFLKIPSDKPVLLNSQRNGFIIAFETFSGLQYIKFQVGINYDETINDFTMTSTTGYSVLHDAIKDIMVEYN